MDAVYKKGSWALISLEEDDLESIPQYREQLQSLKHGTLVIWENLDRMLKGTATPDKLMNWRMDYVRDQLALTELLVAQDNAYKGCMPHWFLFSTRTMDEASKLERVEGIKRCSMY